MTHDSIDIRYAIAQLGLAHGATLEQAQEVLSGAVAYRFATRTRIDKMQRMVEFMAARNKFGGVQASFTEIRAAYHKRVKALHPDQNKGDVNAEERLKAVNAAYEIIDKIHREAREYYRQDEEIRHEIEKQARQAAEREAEARGRRRRAPEDDDRDHKAENAKRAAEAERRRQWAEAARRAG